MALRYLHSIAQVLPWLAEQGVRGLATDSRKVVQGDAFIAWPGHAQDGRQFVGAAIEAGAAACLVEADGVEAFDFDDDKDRIAALDGLKQHTGPIASAFMGSPSGKLGVVAITGTNGKTSSAWWTAQALTSLGRRTGVVGTLGIGEPPTSAAASTIQATGLTTPDPVTLQAAFRSFVERGCMAVALEASSIGLVDHRLDGTHIDVAVFTNFTQDHLDFHESMATYWQAKARLFHWPGLKSAVINVDDPQGASLAHQLESRPLDLWTCSRNSDSAGNSDGGGSGDALARLRATNIVHGETGISFDVVEREGAEAAGIASVRTSLIGDYNVSNLLGVIGALRALGVGLADATRACGDLTAVPGRMQRVDIADGGQDGAQDHGALPVVVVDYAHTPDALEKALLALQPLAQSRGGALWCVFGCGGNRDAAKRPLMGAIAEKLATHTIPTSDNPRLEDPRAILSQITAGMTASSPRVVEDRREAIALAVGESDANDVILIAGKGHEDYQDIAGVKHPFDDVAEARGALQSRITAEGQP